MEQSIKGFNFLMIAINRTKTWVKGDTTGKTTRSPQSRESSAPWELMGNWKASHVLHFKNSITEWYRIFWLAGQEAHLHRQLDLSNVCLETLTSSWTLNLWPPQRVGPASGWESSNWHPLYSAVNAFIVQQRKGWGGCWTGAGKLILDVVHCLEGGWGAVVEVYWSWLHKKATLSMI